MRKDLLKITEIENSEIILCRISKRVEYEKNAERQVIII